MLDMVRSVVPGWAFPARKIRPVVVKVPVEKIIPVEPEITDDEIDDIVQTLLRMADELEEQETVDARVEGKPRARMTI
jgi:hypothetical protein